MHTTRSVKEVYQEYLERFKENGVVTPDTREKATQATRRFFDTGYSPFPFDYSTTQASS